MLLELRNITKKYNISTAGEALTVLDGISLNVVEGESIAVVGPSGSGKSTLLNIMGALDRPTAGSVMFDGNNMAHMSDNDLAHIRNRKIGFVFQMHHLLPQCTVIENVLVPTLPLGHSETHNKKQNRARELLDRVGLGNHIDYFPARLSGGERQRVAVVRALINNPSLILADEPTGSLDQTTAESLVKMLLELNRESRTTLVVVTHSFDLAGHMERVYRLSNGKLENYN